MNRKKRSKKPTRMDRRDVLRGVGTIAATSLLGCDVEESGANETLGVAKEPVLFGTATNPDARPSVLAQGTTGYAADSVIAGTTIHIKSSASSSYDVRLVRPGRDTLTPSKDVDYGLIASVTAPTQQWIKKGSYVYVPSALAPLNGAPITKLTLECWVRPFLPVPPGSYTSLRRGLVTQYSRSPDQCGFGLFLDENLRPVCYFGNGGAFNAAFEFAAAPAFNSIAKSVQGASMADKWNHIVAVFDGTLSAANRIKLFLNGSPMTPANPSQLAGPTSVTPGAAPLRLGASGQSGVTNHFVDGDLAMVAIYSKAMSITEVQSRSNAAVPPTPSGNVEAWWNFADEDGPNVPDSISARDGIIRNHGTRMIGGPGFNAETSADAPFPIPLVGGQPAWRSAIRLMRDDLIDCEWITTHPLPIPQETPPGLYVARFLEKNAAPPPAMPSSGYDIPIVVRPASNKPKAPIAVLASTTTWHIYKQPWNVPHHYEGPYAAGAPVYRIGRNLPFISGDSGAGGTHWSTLTQNVRSLLYQKFQTDGSNVPYYDHLVAAERPLHVWLERNGYEYDLLADSDLVDGVLDPYRVVMVVGHSEYWTPEMVDAVDGFLAGGGKVICLSGNTMYWRTSYLGAPTSRVPGLIYPGESIESRKYHGIGQNTGWPGERYHSTDVLTGGLWRDQEQAPLDNKEPWRVLGLDMFGYQGGFNEVFVEQVGSDVHPFLRSPENTGLQINDSLGGPRTVGHEFDVRRSTFPDPPAFGGADATVIARAYYGGSGSTIHLYSSAVATTYPQMVVNEVVEWVRPDGSRVLNSGSIATAGAMIGLHGDSAGEAQLGRFYRNALHAMGVEQRLGVCAVAPDKRLKMAVHSGSSFGSFSDVDIGASPTFDGGKPPIGIMWAPNALGIMAFDTAGHLQYNFLDTSQPSPTPFGWQDLGNTFVGRPAAVAWSRSRLNLFARGNNNRVYELVFDGANWVPSWNDLGGPIKGDPAAIVQDGRRISVAVVGFSDGHIYYKYRYADAGWTPSTTFSDFGMAGAVGFVSVTMLAWQGNYVTIFGLRSDHEVYLKQWNGLTWSGWVQPSGLGGGGIVSRLAVATWGPAQCTLFAVGPSNRLLSNFYNGAWNGWQDFGLTVKLDTEPVATTFRGGSICVAATDTFGTLRHRIWDGVNWSAWTAVSAVTSSPGVFAWIKS